MDASSKKAEVNGSPSCHYKASLRQDGHHYTGSPAATPCITVHQALLLATFSRVGQLQSQLTHGPPNCHPRTTKEKPCRPRCANALFWHSFATYDPRTSNPRPSLLHLLSSTPCYHHRRTSPRPHYIPAPPSYYITHVATTSEATTSVSSTTASSAAAHHRVASTQQHFLQHRATGGQPLGAHAPFLPVRELPINTPGLCHVTRCRTGSVDLSRH